jgi:hypothetical protein
MTKFFVMWQGCEAGVGRSEKEAMKRAQRFFSGRDLEEMKLNGEITVESEQGPCL